MFHVAAAVWFGLLVGGGVFATVAFAQQADDPPASEAAPPEAPASAPAPAPPSVGLEDVVEERVEGNQSGVASQKRIDGIADETDSLAIQYRTVIHQIDALRIYNRQVENLIASQDEEIADFGQQIDEVELVGRQVTPLMLGMIGALENFVELDVPFLEEERSKRIAALRELMERSDVTDAERYRRILEAYQIENEYGRTIEAYEGELTLNGSARTVDYLRVGRVVFIYQTRDETEAGVWDQENREWKLLGADSRSAIRQGLRIARKQAAPDLLRLPVPSAKVVQ
jgi:hypothetical protein